MKVKAIPTAWLHLDGRRLDCGPYMSGALEAKIRLEEISCHKDRLANLCEGGADGIYHAGRESRTWVDDPEFGVPFLSSSSILASDLSGLPLISKKQVAANPRFTLRPGWTLITRSGTIGRMVYARPDMDGLACSEHVMRVVPDVAKVRPGYLFAFLSSKFGVPLVTSGTYGSIIQSIEPQHIADLPVPRLGDRVERRAHELIEEAASLRSSATNTLKEVGAEFDELTGDIKTSYPSPRVGSVSASSIQRRFDAQYHDPLVQLIRTRLEAGRSTTVGEMCTTVFLPGIFKRIHVEDPRYGVPYFTGASLFWLEPIPKGILSRRTKLFEEVELHKDTILVQAFGQDGGITGKAVWVGRHLDRATSTHMLCRLRTDDRVKTAYLFGFLNSEAALRQISVLTYGGSIPHFDEAGISTVVVPLLDGDEGVQAIGKRVLSALDGRDVALTRERKARVLVERAIEEAT